MVERGFRILGWVFVVLGVCLPFAGIGAYVRGDTISWWEPFALFGAAASVILFGLLFALPKTGPRFKVVVLSTWGTGLLAFGVVALLVPADVLVSRGRRPRTIFMAQFRGLFMLVTGGALIWWAVVLTVRRWRERTGTPHTTSH